MDKLPKLQRCPQCGKEPDWYSAWADADYTSMGLWLACDCKQIQSIAQTSLCMGYIGKLYVERTVNRMSEEWNKYCESKRKETIEQ